jgi:hypothetical protein
MERKMKLNLLSGNITDEEEEEDQCSDSFSEVERLSSGS